MLRCMISMKKLPTAVLRATVQASPAQPSLAKLRTVVFQTAIVMASTNIAGTMFLSLRLFLLSVMFPA